MAKSRRTAQYKHGDAPNIYLPKSVDEQVLNYINKQSDLSGFFLLGVLLLHERFGDGDLYDSIPRSFKFPEGNINSILRPNVQSHSTTYVQETIPSTIGEQESVATSPTNLQSSEETTTNTIKNVPNENENIQSTPVTVAKATETTETTETTDENVEGYNWNRIINDPFGGV